MVNLEWKVVGRSEIFSSSGFIVSCKSRLYYRHRHIYQRMKIMDSGNTDDEASPEPIG